MAEALDDAENRLRSGGGLLSKQGGINLLDIVIRVMRIEVLLWL